MALIQNLGLTLLIICAFKGTYCGILEEYSEYYDYEETEKPTEKPTTHLFLTKKDSMTGILKRPLVNPNYHGLKNVQTAIGGGGLGGPPLKDYLNACTSSRPPRT